MASEPLDDWRLYLRYSVLNEWSDRLPQACADEAFSFFGTTLSGTPKQSDRWKRGVDAAERNGADLSSLVSFLAGAASVPLTCDPEGRVQTAARHRSC